MDHTDFDKAFQEGYTFKYKIPHDQVTDVTFSVHNIGELVLTSGKVIACSASKSPNQESYFTQHLIPGRYPVILSIADFKQREKRIACVMLRLSNEAVVKWQWSPRQGDDLSKLREGEAFGYGVDGGLGCFMDVDAAQILNRAALEKFEREYNNRLVDELNKSSFQEGHHTANWANVRVSESTEANVIAFSTGIGDGCYASYWGYDVENNLVCLVTDFEIFCEEESEEDEI